jgi:hypothetical protein
MDPDQRLFINLESMWEDFERSVESLITLVSSGDERRRRTLESWRQRQWSVQEIVFDEQTGMTTTTTASASSLLSVSVASASAQRSPEQKT